MIAYKNILFSVVLLFSIVACSERYTLSIESESKQEKYKALEIVSINTERVKGDSIFQQWKGGMGYIQDVYALHH